MMHGRTYIKSAKIYLTWRGKYSKEFVARRVRNTGCRQLLNVIQEEVVESVGRR